MEKITNKNLTILTDELKKSIAPILEKHGLVLTRHRGQYTNGPNGSLKLEFSTVDENGVSQADRSDWEFACATTDLEEDWFGKSFTISGGQTHTIKGYNTRARKRPVITKADNGKEYAWPERNIIYWMGK